MRLGSSDWNVRCGLLLCAISRGLESLIESEVAMTSDGLPEYCLILNWGAFRFSLTSKSALLAWSAIVALGLTGLSWQKLLALL